MNMPNPLHLTSLEITVVFLGSMVCSAVAVVLPFYWVSRNEKLTMVIAQGNATFLRYITVIVVVWSAAVLALLGQMSEGPAALLGTVVGYVFGHVKESQFKPMPPGIPDPLPPLPPRSEV